MLILLKYIAWDSEGPSTCRRIQYIHVVIFALQGDSGGPLMCKGVQVGITSFGIANKPGVYTFLSKEHIAWIKDKMRKSEFF